MFATEAAIATIRTSRSPSRTMFAALSSLLVAAIAFVMATPANAYTPPSASFQKGYAQGKATGQKHGYQDGYKDAYEKSYNDALMNPNVGAMSAQAKNANTMNWAQYKAGYKAGYRDGYKAGFRSGKRDGGRDGYDDGANWKGNMREKMRECMRNGTC